MVRTQIQLTEEQVKALKKLHYPGIYLLQNHKASSRYRYPDQHNGRYRRKTEKGY